MSRRQLLSLSALLALEGCTLSADDKNSDYWFDTNRLEIVSKTINIPRLPPSFAGYRIGFLTDIHHGTWLDPGLLESCLAAIQNAKVDLLLLGGDYVYGPPNSKRRFVHVVRNPAFSINAPSHRLIKMIASDLAERLSPVAMACPDGAIAVLGNHDRWHHPTCVIDALTRDPFTLLMNSSTTISRGTSHLTVIGVEDYLTGRPYLPKIAKTSPRDEEIRILISHNPDYVPVAHQESPQRFDLILCGHTHGGQINLPLVGAIIYNVEHRSLAESLSAWRTEDGRVSPVYTSRGIGVVEMPFRFRCPAELTILTLQS